MIIAQITLVQTFVSDLLDLSSLKVGGFSLNYQVFDPNEVMQMLCEIFAL